MKNYLVEFIGTFFLMLSITLSVNGGLGNFAPIAIGITLTVMVYAGGHISGAHYNPAVSFAVYLRGKLSAKHVLPYIASQALGAVLAVLLGAYLLIKAGAPEPVPMTLDIGTALVAEFLGTFALCYVILNVATSEATAGNSYYGMAIGFTVLAMAYLFGGISGGAFNPAVALGITTTGMATYADIWIYLVANFAGGALSAFVFNFTNDPD